MWDKSCSGCSLSNWLFSSGCTEASGSIGSSGSGECVTKSKPSSSSVKSFNSKDLSAKENVAVFLSR